MADENKVKAVFAKCQPSLYMDSSTVKKVLMKIGLSETEASALLSDFPRDKLVTNHFIEQTFDQDGVSASVKRLLKMAGRGGVSRLMLKDGAAGFQDLNDVFAMDGSHEKLAVHAQDSAEALHCIHFWGKYGSKLYTYSGLDTISKHDQHTGIGVLMLDRYAIQERVGDPASPFTWWPYQAFYAIPKGVDFAMCKRVGSAGTKAMELHPEETRAICNSLRAMVEVACQEGKTRIFVTADCGYYALAIEAYDRVLVDLGWVKKPDAAFCAPCYSWENRITIFLCLGTTQMISTPDPTKNIVSRLTNSRVIYGTADLRGWYGGDVLDKLNEEYPSADRMAGILRANEGVLWGMLLVDTPEKERSLVWEDIAGILVEFTYGSAHFLLGMFIGWCAGNPDGKPCAFLHWNDIPKLGWQKLMETKKAWDEGRYGQSEFSKYLQPAYLATYKRGVRDGIFEPPKSGHLDTITYEEVSSDELLATSIYLLGVRSSDVKDSELDYVKALSKRIMKATVEILQFDEGQDRPSPDSNVACLGPRYIDWYCKFQVRLNQTVVKDAFDKKKVGHAIDGSTVALLDCKFIPGFGKQVADGLTVWCYSPFFFWMSYIYARFGREIAVAAGSKPVVYHLECTELFNFTDFLQANGVPTIDNPNYLCLASYSTDRPLAFQRYSSEIAPAAMLFQGSSWYRASDVCLRTPAHDAFHYNQHARRVFPSDIKGLPGEEWDTLLKGMCKVGERVMGVGKGQPLYVESTELTSDYVGLPRSFTAEGLQGSVQYAP